MSKRAVIYLAAGLICALGAVLLVKKYMRPAPSPAPTSIPLVQALIAYTDMESGVPLVLHNKETKVDGNCGFGAWPKAYVPAGAYTDEKEFAKATEKGPYYTKRAFVKDELILKPQLQMELPVPAGMYLHQFDMKRGMEGLKRGDIVDILQLPPTGQTGEAKEFITCAQVHSVKPPATEDDKKTPVDETKQPGRVFVQLPNELQQMMMDTESKFPVTVRLSVHECTGKAATPVKSTDVVNAERARAAFAAAEELFNAKRYEEARAAYQAFQKDYGTSELAPRARERLQACEGPLADELLKQMIKVAGEGNYDLLGVLNERLRKDFPQATGPHKEADALLKQVEQARAAKLQEGKYREEYNKLNETLKGGNLPLVRERLAEFKKQFTGYAPPPPMLKPEEVYKEIYDKLMKEEMAFSLAKNVFQALPEKSERRLEKYTEMVNRWPQHPYVRDNEKKMRAEEWTPPTEGGN